MSETPRCDLILDRLIKGRVITFLGAGVNLCAHSLIVEWDGKVGVLPSGWDLAKHLARKFRYPGKKTSLDLLRVSQYVEVEKTKGTLYDELHDLFNQDFPVTPVHRFLASFPALRRTKGLKDRYQVILTTNYDDVLERAFLEAGEPFDVVCYNAQAKSKNFGMFWHRSSDGTTDQLIASPNSYSGLLGERTVILKIHGAVERREETGVLDSYVISEDDYIDYMAYERALDRFPIPIREKLVKSSFLFLGYALRDWNLRILLRRIWQDQPIDQQSWAVAKKIEAMDKRFWSKRNVEIIDTDLAEFVRTLEEKIEAMPVASVRP